MPGEGFKALADPTRRRILELLREGNCTAGELAKHFDISKPSLSHHLATLKNAGLVTDERHGQNIVYSLNTTVMQDLIGWFMGFTNNEGDKDEKRKQGHSPHRGIVAREDCAGRSVRRQCRSAPHGDAELACADSHALGRERRCRRLGS